MCRERAASKLTVSGSERGMDLGVGLSFNFVQLSTSLEREPDSQFNVKSKKPNMEISFFLPGVDLGMDM